jgi:hypothetical protein
MYKAAQATAAVIRDQQQADKSALIGTCPNPDPLLNPNRILDWDPYSVHLQA